MSNTNGGLTMRTIELCSNDEWVVNHLMGGLGLEFADPESASNQWFDTVSDRIKSLMPDLKIEPSAGQRAFYHGWNGANIFARKGHGLGAFDNFSDEEWDQLTTISLEVACEIEERYDAAGKI